MKGGEWPLSWITFIFKIDYFYSHNGFNKALRFSQNFWAQSCLFSKTESFLAVLSKYPLILRLFWFWSASLCLDSIKALNMAVLHIDVRNSLISSLQASIYPEYYNFRKVRLVQILQFPWKRNDWKYQFTENKYSKFEYYKQTSIILDFSVLMVPFLPNLQPSVLWGKNSKNWRQNRIYSIKHYLIVNFICKFDQNEFFRKKIYLIMYSSPGRGQYYLKIKFWIFDVQERTNIS